MDENKDKNKKNIDRGFPITSTFFDPANEDELHLPNFNDNDLDKKESISTDFEDE